MGGSIFIKWVGGPDCLAISFIQSGYESLFPPGVGDDGKLFHRLAEQLYLRQAQTYREIIRNSS